MTHPDILTVERFGYLHPEPESIGICGVCNEPICAGESYADINDVKYHEDCLGDLSTEDWLDMFGIPIQEAEP